MILNRNIIPLLLALLCITSCKISDSIRTIQVEIMKPVDYDFPVNVKTVAIIKRDLNKRQPNFDTINFVPDTTCNYNELTNSCFNGLSGFFEKEASIQTINNDSNSLKDQLADPDLKYKLSSLFEITKTDAIIFLDQFKIENGVFSFFDGTFRTRADLSWAIKFRNESQPIFYHQTDTLFFSKSQYKDILLKNKHSQQIYLDATKSLAESFGRKLIPTWISDGRSYYHSNQLEMLMAEKYLKNQDWLKAGEIWNKQTKNKNKKIAAKACYNMALVCELEGKYDLAMEWVTESNHILTTYNYQHRIICQHYYKLLSLRQDEIQTLAKQIRN